MHVEIANVKPARIGVRREHAHQFGSLILADRVVDDRREQRMQIIPCDPIHA